MKQRIGYISVGIAAVAVAVFIYSKVRVDQRTIQLEQPLEPWRGPEGQFPELKPVIEVPAGFDLTLKDGPDFYAWTLAEREMVGKTHRSGVGIYLGHHPARSVAKNAQQQMAGIVCNQPVTWLETRKDDPADKWVVRDAFLNYNYGPGFMTISLHVWIWGQSDEQIASLVKQVEGLSFDLRKE